MENKIEKVREMFLDFFYKKKHKIIKGSSLIPKNDTSLLFTNAGMNQFKEYFLGYKKSPYPRITTIQKCIRVGGKHNDLENVGFTNRHHTFFEMLGNFSFGDYFKKEAIFYAWELLTSSKWFNLEKKKIYITVYYTDIETYNIWYKNIGIPRKNILLIKDKNNKIYHSDNFWQMSETGPCGPSTEIFYDLGHNLKDNIKNNTYNRFIEIWNIVFIQFNKNLKEELIPLPIKSVDTGMGLERISSILEGVNSNYKLYFFQKIIKNINNFVKIKNLKNNSLKVIADHIRSSIYLISEGILPNNEKRGYILRKILRRAINHGRILGVKKPFLYKLVKIYIKYINNTEKIFLYKKYDYITNIIKNEEENFNKIINSGILLLEKEIKKSNKNFLSGKQMFYLYDTFGLSPDLIQDICINKKINFDKKEFIKYMDIQRQKSRKNIFFEKKINLYYENRVSKFDGYSNFTIYSKILDIYFNEKLTNKINEGESGEIILNITSFYGESGGQLGDIGYLEKDKKNIFQVYNTKIHGNLIIHIGKMILGSLKIDDYIFSRIDITNRLMISRNHSATHLLHSILRQKFGNGIEQKGSLITNQYLRFDFSYNYSLELEDIFDIEKKINNYIFKNIPIKIYLKKKKELQNNKNIIKLFNNKYGKIVRIVDIQNISQELCSGTHILSTQEIGFFIITKFLSIANGIKRIHAITHNLALDYVQKQNKNIKIISNIFRIDEKNLIKNILLDKKKINILKNNIQELEQYISLKEEKNLIKNIILINNINLIISKIYNFNPKLFNYIIKKLLKKFKKTIIFLSTKWEKKIFFIIKITTNINKKINAKEIIQKILDKNSCKVNGCANIAQGNINLNKDEYYFFLSKIRLFILNKINKLD
ncbi:alanine--tRNA ligase [Enterobacteriaceae endosymbiont of Donacia bicoloricornis]|uniref:alanine--tRNA ligase n=1 Tax=Enterobacteriaceae endosymbiont of Donacia bicoloricornis TaxID=2675772 RepID=UPI001448B7B7|nr:alanine--tRNA ligase [Enterobacteriaceae endosymbiont of Donacia bicoloricornis]QJC37574.1 alanine--tRNA ligase [Enterobacteriaceae endosymbiont of Donacia bicoloricornis]